MKKTFYFTLLLIISFSGKVTAEELAILTGEWPPYVSQDLPGQGPAAEIVRTIVIEAGYEPRLVFYPWKRVEAMVESGEAFGAFPYCLNEDRRARFFVSEPTNQGRNIFYLYSGNAKTPDTLAKATLETLSGFTVGVLRGSFLGKTLRDAGFSHLVENDTTVRLLQQMRLGRIDLVMGEAEVIKSAITQLPPAEREGFYPVEASPVPLLPNGLIVSKRYPGAQEILNNLNGSLGRLMASGEYRKLIERLGLYLK